MHSNLHWIFNMNFGKHGCMAYDGLAYTPRV